MRIVKVVSMKDIKSNELSFVKPRAYPPHGIGGVCDVVLMECPSEAGLGEG